MFIFVHVACIPMACVREATGSISGLHPEDAEVGLLDGRIEGCTDAKSQNQPGVHGVNNPIIPQPVER